VLGADEPGAGAGLLAWSLVLVLMLMLMQLMPALPHHSVLLVTGNMPSSQMRMCNTPDMPDAERERGSDRSESRSIRLHLAVHQHDQG
jgi:hypothetical protein